MDISFCLHFTCFPSIFFALCLHHTNVHPLNLIAPFTILFFCTYPSYGIFSTCTYQHRDSTP